MPAITNIIPNGSRVNLYTSGGPHGGPRLELVKASAPTPSEDAETLRAKLREAKEFLRRKEEEQALDPAHVYAARRAGNQAAKAPESTLDASAIYAARVSQ